MFSVMGIIHSCIMGALPWVPEPLMRRLSSRYIAGETLAEAMAVIGTNASSGFSGVLDILGEGIEDEAAAREALAAYKQAASELGAAGRDCYVSVKPTHFGLSISPGLALELYADLAEHCQGLGQTMRVEMEDHPTTDATLDLFHSLRKQFDHVGIVLQSRLLRTPDDIQALGSEVMDVRMVKGIYLEPASVAHCERSLIQDAYVECTKQLWLAGHRVALATHDGPLAERCLAVATELKVAPERLEFEVLLGVQEPLWKTWKQAGHKVRVYVPYGPEWRSYSERRLRKNPEILGHVMRNLLR
jgi:proline dehydrogenase